MYKIITMSIGEFLNKKLFEMQLEKGRRISLKEFAESFEVSQALLSMWMNGERPVSEKHKKRIIERYGAEAVQAFGGDPDLHFLQEKWDLLTPEKRRSIREQVEEYATQNETKRASNKRRTV